MPSVPEPFPIFKVGLLLEKGSGKKGAVGPGKEPRMAIYDLLWKEGEDKSGKARWNKVGILMEKGDGKKSVKLTALPVGSWDGWLVVAERKERDEPH